MWFQKLLFIFFSFGFRTTEGGGQRRRWKVHVRPVGGHHGAFRCRQELTPQRSIWIQVFYQHSLQSGSDRLCSKLGLPNFYLSLLVVYWDLSVLYLWNLKWCPVHGNRLAVCPVRLTNMGVTVSVHLGTFAKLFDD